jgi:hypothetical protein
MSNFGKRNGALCIVRFVKAIGHVEIMEDSRMPKRVMREKIYTRKKGVDQRLDGQMTFKRTYER